MIPPKHLFRATVARMGRTFAPILLAAATMLLPLASLADQPTEYQIKAAFMYNFAKFVDWPPSTFKDTNDPIVIGIVGENPFGDALANIAQSKTAQGRPLQLRHFKPGDDYSGCQMLFISNSAASRASEILQAISGQPILSIGEYPDFIQQGGMIGFALVDNTIRFDINAKAAEAASLKFSSKLLAVARTVVKPL